MDELWKSTETHSDALAHFLRSATSQPLKSPAWALAEALGKTLHPSDVVVRWEINRHAEESATTTPCEARWSVSARAAREGKGAEINGLVWTFSTPYPPFELSKLAEGAPARARGLRIGKSSPSTEPTSNLEIIFLENGESFPTNRIEDFFRNVEGITTLYQAFAALQAARLTTPRRAPAEDFVTYMVKCRTALENLVSFPAMQEQVVEGFTLELFGIGWDVHNLSGPAGRQSLAELMRHLRSISVDNPQLSVLYAILAASRGEKPRGNRRAGNNLNALGSLDLIAHWTYLHFRAREILRLGPAQGDWTQREYEYLKEASACYSSLARFLLSQLPKNSEPMESTLLSSWLRLWFCLTLLEELVQEDLPPTDEGKKGSSFRSMSKPTRWRFFADLAYVIRESLRGITYGTGPSRRPEFKFQPVVFASALCTLVEQHGLRILQLPQSLDLGGLLRKIGRLSLGGGPYFATSHLQHVLEMYIGGLFLSSTRTINVEPAQLDAQFEGATISEVLAGAGTWRAGQPKQQEFRKAFGLAVLLHDIGMLLFPYWPRRAERLAELDSGLRKNLKGIRDILNSSVQQLLTTCERELCEAGIYDPLKEPQIRAWIEDCREHGEADHSVLGAWYLVRITRNDSGFPSSTLQQAARAILLHAIPTHVISVEEDPVAALLVLCDELVVWREGHEPPQANEAGRYFHSIAGELRPEDSIYDKLHIPGLRVSLGEKEKGLSCSLDLSENLKTSPGSTWPQIEIEFRKPEQLPSPVYQLWLAASQNLGRIDSSQSHWGPVLHMSSEVPARQPPIGTRELLGRIVHHADFPLRPCLQRWLELYEPSEKREASGSESVSLGPSDSFYNGRIKLLFPELDWLVEKVLHEEGLRHQKPPTKTRPGPSRSAKENTQTSDL